MNDDRVDRVATAMLSAANDHYSIKQRLCGEWDIMTEVERHWWRGRAKMFLAAQDASKASDE